MIDTKRHSLSRRTVLRGALVPFAMSMPFIRPSYAASPVKIGSMSDLSSVYADITGPALVKTVQMAIDDFGPCLGQKAELVAADCQLKPDIGLSIARNWFDTQGVDAVIDLPSTSVALPIMQLSVERKKIVLATSAGSSDISGKYCSPYTTQWVYDSYAMARTIGPTIIKDGGDSFFFIAADYAFGASLVNDASALVQAAGGKVMGVVRAPLNTADFSSYLLQAQASKAKIIILANAGADAFNCIKQATEFGIQKAGQKIAALVLMDPDVHSIGLPIAQGTLMATAFYWDRNDASRQFSKRFFDAVGRMPSMLQAGAYSQANHYLKAVQAAGTKDADKVIEKMRELPVDDFFSNNGRVRKDGLMVHDMFLAQVKSPEKSKSSWDQLDILETVPGNQAFRSMENGACKAV